MKQREREAKMILERKGIAFDEKHQDNGSEHSLPDLKYLVKDRYLEVTHTFHNIDIVKKTNRFHQKSTNEQLDIMKKASAAYERVCHIGYSETEEGEAQYKRDLKLLKSHFGFEPSKLEFSEQFSEFCCDCPVIECTPEKIIREVVEKGKKHSSGNTNLFIFVLEDEFSLMMDLLKDGDTNVFYASFCNTLQKSPFSLIYVCVWNFETQIYETENPVLIKIEKTDNGNMSAMFV